MEHGDLVTEPGHPAYDCRSDESGSADHQHSHADSSFPNTPENIISRLAVVRCERTSRGSSKCFGLYLDFDHFESASREFSNPNKCRAVTFLFYQINKTQTIRYEIRYRRILAESGRIFVDYTYSASYRIPGTKGEEWRRRVEDNRLELVPFQDEFRIVAGM